MIRFDFMIRGMIFFIYSMIIVILKLDYLV
jgi:hypothetical protein